MASVPFPRLETALRKGPPAAVWYLHGSEGILKDEALRTLIDTILDPSLRDFNLDLLSALCDIVNCTADDLLELRREHVRDTPVAVNDHGPGIGDLKPVRAIIRRPHE